MPLDAQRLSLDVTRLTRSLEWATTFIAAHHADLSATDQTALLTAQEAIRLAVEDENYPHIFKAFQRLRRALFTYSKLLETPERPNQDDLDLAHAEVVASHRNYLTQMSRLALWPS